MNKKVFAFGLWAESTGKPEHPLFKTELLNELLTDKEDILDYLKSGIQLLTDAYPIKSLLDEVLFYETIYTDGSNMWTESAMLYFERYDLVLPPSFVKYAKEERKVPPYLPSDLMEQLRKVAAFWLRGEGITPYKN